MNRAVCHVREPQVPIAVALNLIRTGRKVLAIGGQKDATQMMGLPAERATFLADRAAGGLAGVLQARLMRRAAA